uniref:C-type lectin domain-containing protein n=1 Tax=Anisakis simplex TaxID=6269 RepID=A0A0M3J0V7_ANISI
LDLVLSQLRRYHSCVITVISAYQCSLMSFKAPGLVELEDYGKITVLASYGKFGSAKPISGKVRVKPGNNEPTLGNIEWNWGDWGGYINEFELELRLKVAFKDASNGKINDAGNDIINGKINGTGNDIINGKINDAGNDLGNDTINDTGNDLGNDTIKDTVNDLGNDTIKDASNGKINDTIKDTVSDRGNDTINDTGKLAVINDIINDTINDLDSRPHQHNTKNHKWDCSGMQSSLDLRLGLRLRLRLIKIKLRDAVIKGREELVRQPVAIWAPERSLSAETVAGVEPG